MKKVVTIALGQVELAVPVIRRLYGARFRNMKAAYAVMKNIQILDTELRLLNEGQQRLLREYAELDEQGRFIPAPEAAGGVKLKVGTADEFWQAFNSFRMQSIEVTLHMIPFEALEALTNAEDNVSIQISPRELLLIDFMLEAQDEPLMPVPPSEMN